MSDQERFILATDWRAKKEDLIPDASAIRPLSPKIATREHQRLQAQWQKKWWAGYNELKRKLEWRF